MQLNAFQSDLAKEDIRFTERQSKLIEQQKQEKEGIRQEFEVCFGSTLNYDHIHVGEAKTEEERV